MNDKGFRPKQIIILECNLFFSNQLVKMFDPNYIVHIGNTTEEAKRLLTREKPDLIISEMEMPVKSGVELIKEFRLNPECRKIPVVFLTSNGDEQSKLSALQAGAVHYITKPFIEDHLKLKVDNILQIYESRIASVAYEDIPLTLMQKVDEILSKEYKNKELMIFEIADKLYMSQGTLERKFSLECGMTLVQYIRFFRLTQARKMLVKGQYRIGEIADKCGFSSLHYFSRVFKEYFGENPSELLLRPQTIQSTNRN